jgi:hypothetical protein
MGTCITSGGMGKKMASQKETRARSHVACRVLARWAVQS